MMYAASSVRYISQPNLYPNPKFTDPLPVFTPRHDMPCSYLPARAAKDILNQFRNHLAIHPDLSL
jgi:hypothetical protein